jgi:iron complex transport system substrate-binding protein
MTRFLAALVFLLLGILPAEARIVTDAAGRKVDIPDKVERVLVAGPPAAVLVYALAPEKLAGWVSKPSDAAKTYLAPQFRDLPTIGRLTGKEGRISSKAVAAARPDIIVDVGTVDPTYSALADRVQAETHIPYVLIDGSFGRTGETLRQAGDILGVGDRAKMLADYADATIKDLNDKLAAVPVDQRPRVYYGRGADGLETGLSGSINLEILDAVGAVNVAASAGKGGLTKVTAQQVADWNPDVILGEDEKFVAKAKTDPQWAGVKAVKDGKVFVTPSLPFGWFDTPPGVNRLLGIRWLETLFYPQTFKNDLSADVRGFYKLFYQVDLTDDQLAALMKSAAE